MWNDEWPRAISYYGRQAGKEHMLDAYRYLELFKMVYPEMKKENTSYEFQIKHISQLDWKEIEKDLSYKNPLAVVKISSDEVYFVIHGSIIRKYDQIAFFATNLMDLEEISLVPDVYKGTEKDIAGVINDLKAIKSAPYEEGSVTNKVKVVLPTI